MTILTPLSAGCTTTREEIKLVVFLEVAELASNQDAFSSVPCCFFVSRSVGLHKLCKTKSGFAL